MVTYTHVKGNNRTAFFEENHLKMPVMVLVYFHTNIHQTWQQWGDTQIFCLSCEVPGTGDITHFTNVIRSLHHRAQNSLSWVNNGYKFFATSPTERYSVSLVLESGLACDLFGPPAGNVSDTVNFEPGLRKSVAFLQSSWTSPSQNPTAMLKKPKGVTRRRLCKLPETSEPKAPLSAHCQPSEWPMSGVIAPGTLQRMAAHSWHQVEQKNCPAEPINPWNHEW